jgi:cytochrome c oxidase accessory protein FixG
MMHTDPIEQWSSFLFVFITAGILYFNFAWFREQLCIVICPYGRLQSALIDDNTMVIGYDENRGEPRGKQSANRLQSEKEPVGDCVDCARCVQVCPTGIDIRQGLQIECIGCAACIDACDTVMAKTGRLPGLIRYDSFNGLNQRPTRWLRPRTILYAVLLVIGATVAALSLRTVQSASLMLTRMTGAAYYADDTAIRNQFLLRLINKTDQPATFILHIAQLPNGASSPNMGNVIELAPLGEVVRPVIIQQTLATYVGPFRLHIEASTPDKKITLTREAEFTGPNR